MSTLSSDLKTLSYEAYLYLYPLVTMNISRLQAANYEAGVRPGFGPPNLFNHMRKYPDADERAVVRVNFDTLYSIAWLDLTGGPVTLRVPDAHDRYYLLPMLDMWTDVIAVPGKRTTGTEAGEFFIAGPDYTDKLPPDKAIIKATTPYLWIIGRTQTNGPADYAAVRTIQDGFTITPAVPAKPHPIDPNLDTQTEPLNIVNRMNAVEFFTYASEALKVVPPHATDFSIIARIANMGIVPGQAFDTNRFTEAQLVEIQVGATEAFNAIQAASSSFGTKANGWTTSVATMGVYGNDYLKRAVITLVGLGANPVEDAVYPLLITDADGEPLVGEKNYVLHFDADKLPPVAAFWSVTMYDAEGFQAANEINRFALGDRDSLTYNADGSLDIYLQHERPSDDHVPNWLPAPLGSLGVTMRLYAPKTEVFDGRWSPPPVRKA